jgi:putative membrane protein
MSAPRVACTGWSWTPSISVPLVVAALLYASGLRRLWGRAGAGRGVPRWRAAAFFGGLAAIALALLSPLDEAADALFSAHMVQHLVLILVAAPLLVLGAPERVAPWVVPDPFRARLLKRAAPLAGAARLLSRPALATTLATLVFWTWHVPALFDRALAHDALHAVEHASFLATAVLFWGSLVPARMPREERQNGPRLLALFTMALQGNLLGALLTFATRPLYAGPRGGTTATTLSALGDQRLAGLIMWVPPTALYLAVGSYLFVRWLRAHDPPPNAVGAGQRARPERPAASSG